jgi:hypothetical protein
LVNSDRMMRQHCRLNCSLRLADTRRVEQYGLLIFGVTWAT